MVLNLPPNAQVTQLPATATVSGAGLEFSLEWKRVPSGLEVSRTLARPQRVVSPADYEAFVGTVDRIHLAEAEPAVVRFGAAR